jgi:hypothetical protein
LQAFFVLAVLDPLALGLLNGVEQLVIGLRDDCLPQLLTKQHVKRLGQLARDRVLVIDQQPLEEREIELPTHPVGRFAVGPLTVASSRQSPL